MAHHNIFKKSIKRGRTFDQDIFYKKMDISLIKINKWPLLKTKPSIGYISKLLTLHIYCICWMYSMKLSFCENWPCATANRSLNSITRKYLIMSTRNYCPFSKNCDWCSSLVLLLESILLTYLHIEAETKWPPFRRRHLQSHFREWKC